MALSEQMRRMSDEVESHDESEHRSESADTLALGGKFQPSEDPTDCPSQVLLLCPFF